MRRQKCSQCGTMLDVSSLEKDSKFACSNCGAILVVGEAVAVKRSLKEGTGFKPKAKDGDAPVAPTRTRRAAAGAGARRRERAEPAAKSKLPLFLGIGGVAVLAVIVVLATTNGDGPPRKTKAERANEWWRNVGVIRGSEKERLEAILAEAEEKGFDEDQSWWPPKRADIMKALLRADPSHPEANRAAGRKCLNTDIPGFEETWTQMNDVYVSLPEELKAFVDHHVAKIDRGRKVWLSPERFTEARALVSRFVEWKKKRDADPSREHVARAIRSATPLYRGKEFAHAVSTPWILLTPFDPDPSGEEGTAKIRADNAARNAKFAAVLPVALAQWKEKIAGPLSLPPVEEDHYFKVLVCDQPADLATYLQGSDAEDAGAGAEIIGFFRWDTKWAGASFLDDEALRPYLAQDLAHVAVHQLQHYHSQDPKDKYENWFDEWSAKWLNEGLAEWLGGGVQFDPASGKATFTGYPRRRIEFLRQVRDNGVPLMRIRDVVQLTTLEDWRKFYTTWAGTVREDENIGEATVTWLNRLGPAAGVRKFFYAQSWLTVHFLHEAKDGEFRDRFLAYVQTALRGKYKPEKYAKRTRDRWISPFNAFEDIFEVRTPDQWDDFQKDYVRYFKRMLRKAE